jgi:hypothetical protein
MRKTKNTNRVSPLISAMQSQISASNVAFTENGAKSLATTESAVLDWFASGASMRAASDSDITSAFKKAFNENKLLATKAAFYIRDVRGGQGERKVFRSVLSWLAKNNPSVVKKNLTLIPDFGRWDDLLVLLDTSLEKDVIELIESQLRKDIENSKKGGSISLLAKWLPSISTSSKESVAKAYKLVNLLGITPRLYRKTLSKLRSYLSLVEKSMCSGNWSEIDYEKVPSRASMIYRKAFPKHDSIRYMQWKGKVASGEAKVNASALYPYDIVSKVLKGENNDTLELQWRALPNYLSGQINKALVVCDVSGSMGSWGGYSVTTNSSVRPMDIAISLAMYFAERCEGPFKDHFITFSSSPKLQKLYGDTLYARAKNLERADWGMNTDVQAVFQLILDKAVSGNLKQSDMPDSIFIVSDMQFDACGQNTNLEAIKVKYQRAGYKLPLLVFWQVRATKDKVSLKNEKGTVLISGFSPSILPSILKLEEPEEVTPYELMMAVLNKERYNSIKV